MREESWPPKRREKIYCRSTQDHKPLIHSLNSTTQWHEMLDSYGFRNSHTFMGLIHQLLDWAYKYEEIRLIQAEVSGKMVDVFVARGDWQFLLPKPLEDWEREFFMSTQPNFVAKNLAEEISAMLDSPI